MRILKSGTLTTIQMGPFVDATDGRTTETGLTINASDFYLSKNGGTFAAKASPVAGTHDIQGRYKTTLSAADVSTLGGLEVQVSATGALLAWKEFMVMSGPEFETLFGTDKFQVDVVELGSDTQSATDLKDFADAGYDPATNKVQGVVLADTVTDVTNQVTADVTAVSGDTTAADNLELDYDGTGYAKANSTIGTTTTNTDMVGTDNAALASVCTEARLAELDAANLPADVDAVLADVTGINGDAMRGTDSAALASVCTEARLAELDAANIPTDLTNIEADTADIQTRIPAALVGGAMDADVSALQAGAITAASIATDAVDADALAADAVTEIAAAGFMVYEKNVAATGFAFMMVDSADSKTPKTGLTPTIEISKDKGAFGAAAGAGTVTEISSGWYYVDLTQADMNADEIIFKATSAGADATNYKIKTQS